MKILESFMINHNSWIEIVVPSFEEKINYFYKPSHVLHQFDEVTVQLHHDQKIIFLCKNTVDEVFFRLKIFLNKIICRERVLERAFIGIVGITYNNDKYSQWKNELDKGVFHHHDVLEYLDYQLYSSEIAETWLYGYKENIYIEVGYSIPCLFSTEISYTDQDFEKFIKTYKPYFFDTISFQKAQSWINQCEKILKQIGV